MQIIIPMSGSGQRFVAKGYTNIKPLILVHAKPIIEYVINLFDVHNDTFIFVCNENHIATTNLKNVLLSIIPTAIIITIPSHKLGPVYAITAAYNVINNEEPCIVNYCDFNMQWNYKDFVQTVTLHNCDGAIPCYTGFHPHLIPTNNVYAGCKVNEQMQLLEITEKYSYTQNKTLSHHSVGTYYFKTGELLKHYTNKLLASNQTVNNEYYASMLYPQMLADSKNILVYDAIPHYCQWGTPYDLEEYNWWHNLCTQHSKYWYAYKQQTLQSTTLLIPMAGAGSRFVQQGYTTPKPLLQVDTMPMYKRAIADLPPCKHTLLITQQTLQLNDDTNTEIIKIDSLTQGQASTCLLAKHKIDNTNPLIIAACDNGMVYNLDKFFALQNEADVIVFTFKNTNAVTEYPNQYGWVAVDDNNNATYISCKKAISNTPKSDHAITGCFWFKQGNYFVKAAEDMIENNTTINGEYYVDECMNNCIQLGLTVKVFEIEKYICWGTPNDYKTYNYWQTYFNKMIQNDTNT